MSHYDLAIMNSAIRMAHGSLIRILHHSRIANKLGATAIQLPHEEVNKSRGHKELLHKVHVELRIAIWKRWSKIFVKICGRAFLLTKNPLWQGTPDAPVFFLTCESIRRHLPCFSWPTPSYVTHMIITTCFCHSLQQLYFKIFSRMDYV